MYEEQRDKVKNMIMKLSIELGMNSEIKFRYFKKPSENLHRNQ